MTKSNVANVLTTTRLLPYFNSKNVTTMRLYIYQQLKCTNESEFLCKVLTSMCSSLSNESTQKIKNKAVEIADSQLMNTTNHDVVSITINKYVEQQGCKDRLSQLHGDIIDYFASFLTKQESIAVGYLNKQLYLESQKQSYLLKRCKDKVLTLDSDRLSKALWPTSNSFNYHFLPRLRLYLHTDETSEYVINKLNEKNLFEKFFMRVNSLTCSTLESLHYVPIEYVFNKTNFFQNIQSREYIENCCIGGDIDSYECDDIVANFAIN